MKLNPLTAIDFYKADHRRQYPEGTTLVYSNFTPRSDKLSTIPAHLFDGTVVVLRASVLHQRFPDRRLEHRVLRQAEGRGRRASTNAGWTRRSASGRIPVDHIEALHDLGYLPICIKALPEGSASPSRCRPW